MRRAIALFFAACVTIACSGGGNDGATFTGAEQSQYDAATPSLIVWLALGGVTNELFQFDPTLDPSQSDVQNAQLVQARVTSSAAGCGSIATSGTTVTATFPASGCKLGQWTVTGTIAVTVTKSSGLSLAMTFTNVTVDGTACDGTVTFATTDGSSFSLDANVTWGTTSFTASNFKISGAGGAVTFGGSLSTSADSASSITFDAVVWNDGDCYPSAGSITVQKAIVTETIAFSAATATAGQVAVTVGKKTVTTTLPAYGTCG